MEDQMHARQFRAGHRPIPSIAAAAICLFAAAASATDNWPRFRGLNAGAIPDNAALPERWSATENVAWKLDVPGLGWGSPVVWDDYVFITTVLSSDARPVPGQDIFEEGKSPSYRGGMQTELSGRYQWVLYAIDFKTGKIRWQRELQGGTPFFKRHPKNTHASETPVTDGKRVYVFHASVGLFAVDFAGKIVWSRPVAPPKTLEGVATKASTVPARDADADIAAMFSNLGAAASPALYKDRIFVTSDHLADVWMMAAYSTADGKELWRVDIPKEQQAYGWATPFVWENERRTEIIAAGDRRVRSFDIDGRLLWELKGLSTNTTPTPFAAGGLLYVSSGAPVRPVRPVYAIRPGASGDISLKDGETHNQFVVWSQKTAATYMPSALVYRDLLYSVYSQGFITCHDAKTGEQRYGRKRIDPAASGFTASPWGYNGKIFATSEDGDTFVVEAGPEFKLVGKNSLGEMILATPAIVRDSLIVRTVGRLYRIADVPKPSRSK
jgi:outer membrane protein assembly factor BamB